MRRAVRRGHDRERRGLQEWERWVVGQFREGLPSAAEAVQIFQGLNVRAEARTLHGDGN
jgi:hypothetical protein